MSLFKNLILSILLVLIGQYAFAAQGDTIRLSLKQAVKMAQDNNLNLRNSQLDLKIAQKKIWETLAIGLPHVDGTAKYTFIPKVPTLPASNFSPNAGPNDVIELGVKQNIVYDLTASQLIFNGAYLIGVKASKTYYQYSKDNLEKSVLDLNEMVTNTYFMVLVGQESGKILSSNLANVLKTFNEVKEMYKQGLVEKTDVDQLELTANTIENAILQVNTNVDVAIRLLKIQLGLNEGTPLILSDPLDMNENQVAHIEKLAAQPFVLENNIDFKLLSTAELLTKYDLKREMSNSLPVIAGYYNRQEKWKKPAFDFAPKDVVGINLSLPIFSTGQRSAAVSQKRLALEKATNNKLYVGNTLLMQSTQVQNDLKVKLDKFRIQKKSKDLSDDIYQRTLEKYRQGVSSSLELMSIQNQYLTNLSNYFQSIYDVVGAQTKLEKLYNIQPAVK